jgi:hypothetical protein
MGRPLKTTKALNVDTGFNNPAGILNTYGVVGGNASGIPGLSTKILLCRVKIGSNAELNGAILRQKGARKFSVTDGSNVGICSLTDSANDELADNTMTITLTLADGSNVRLARITNYHGIDFSGQSYILTFNDPGPAPVGTIASIAQVNSW